MGRVIEKQNELAADAYSTDQTVSQMRAAYRTERFFWNDFGPYLAVSRDGKIPTRHGEISVRMHRNDTEGILPLIVYVHGGGMVVGDLDTHDRICRRLAANTGSAVIAVDYTLSPESQYPQAVEECGDVVTYLVEHGAEWGIDPCDVSFAGDSGGANLSFGTYLWLADHTHVATNVTALLLFYGAYGLTDSMSMRLLGGSWDGLDEASLAFYAEAYLGNQNPLSATYYNVLSSDLSQRMPACFILGLTLDPLRDDSRVLAQMLVNAGHHIEFVEVDGVIHGFLHHGRMLDATDKALAQATEFYGLRSSHQDTFK